MIGQRILVIFVAGAVGLIVGGVVMKTVGERQLSAEARAIAQRFGIRPGGAGTTDLISVIDGLAPGTSDAVKSAAVVTALAGIGSAVIATLALREIAA